MADNVELLIYIRNIKNFFDKNPLSLKKLIGNINKELFYKTIELKAEERFIKKGNPVFTKTELLEIVLELNIESNDSSIFVDNRFLATKYGKICLN